jgi:basic amino acid/polyamine antiporter, APA family
MGNLWVKKPLSQLLSQATETEGGLKRTLGAVNLVALGIGAIIGAGLFVRTAAASAEAAGPAVTLSFIVAAIGCAFAGLCYAEFAAMIPIAGSAYTYAYATLGELVAWIIGWALIMEYALGAATVSIAWSEYLNKLLGGSIPHEWCHSPMEGGIMNAPALIILLLLTLLLIRGTQQSAWVNAVIVAIKVSIVLIFIAIGWGFINSGNHDPYFIPQAKATDPTNIFKYGYGGVLGGAAIVFFAFIGFDAVSTAAQEAKNPAKDMPIGILGSLVVCTILYILFSHVLTGVANWEDFRVAGKEASVAFAIDKYMIGYGWLSTSVTIAILAGFSSVILVMLLGQSRVFYSMANDGLLPKAFSELHPQYSTPYKSNWILFVFVGLFAAFVPGSMAGDLTSFGTLFAFVIVCVGVWVLRIKSPEIHRPFRAPLVPIVSTLGVLVCGSMIIAIDPMTLKTAFWWMALGLGVYFLYSFNRSRLQNLTQSINPALTYGGSFLLIAGLIYSFLHLEHVKIVNPEDVAINSNNLIHWTLGMVANLGGILLLMMGRKK